MDRNLAWLSLWTLWYLSIISMGLAWLAVFNWCPNTTLIGMGSLILGMLAGYGLLSFRA